MAPWRTLAGKKCQSTIFCDILRDAKDFYGYGYNIEWTHSEVTTKNKTHTLAYIARGSFEFIEHTVLAAAAECESDVFFLMGLSSEIWFRNGGIRMPSISLDDYVDESNHRSIPALRMLDDLLLVSELSCDLRRVCRGVAMCWMTQIRMLSECAEKEGGALWGHEVQTDFCRRYVETLRGCTFELIHASDDTHPRLRIKGVHIFDARNARALMRGVRAKFAASICGVNAHMQKNELILDIRDERVKIGEIRDRDAEHGDACKSKMQKI